jgi:hypothetical protein
MCHVAPYAFKAEFEATAILSWVNKDLHLIGEI